MELDRFLFTPAAGDPAPWGFKVEPMDEDIIADMHMNISAATEKFKSENPTFAGDPEVCGRENSFSFLTACLGALKSAELLLCGRINCDSELVAHVRLAKRNNDHPESAKALCVEKALLQAELGEQAGARDADEGEDEHRPDHRPLQPRCILFGASFN